MLKSLRQGVLVARSALLVICIQSGLPAAAAGEIINRVLAVVAGNVIMLSDVMAAQELGLVPREPGDQTRAALSRLIDRSLILSEVERYAPPEPGAAAVDRAVQEIRSRFSSPDTFAETLARAGIDEQNLRETIRQDLRIEAYLDQRFLVIPADDAELAEYYRDHPSVFTQVGVLRPFEEARADVARALAVERRNALVGEWVAGLRRRAEIIDLYQTR